MCDGAGELHHAFATSAPPGQLKSPTKTEEREHDYTTTDRTLKKSVEGIAGMSNETATCTGKLKQEE